MKKILFSLALVLPSILLIAQTISLGTDNEYCPNVEYEFSVTLPGAYSSISATHMLITQQPYAFNSSNTSFKFKAKFNDVNIKQSVEIKYGANGASTFKPEYKKVKSLFLQVLAQQSQVCFPKILLKYRKVQVLSVLLYHFRQCPKSFLT